MPPVSPDVRLWLSQQLAHFKADLAALKPLQTQYVVDPAGVCQAIIGNLSHDHQGASTGLGNVWGIASFKTGVWVRL